MNVKKKESAGRKKSGELDKEYHSVFEGMLEKYGDLLSAALAGSREAYEYRGAKDGSRGAFDLHYRAREGLCFALLFCGEKEREGTEALVRFLFLEELRDRESNSFQGIGANLEILTQLLRRYGRKQDEELFQRAKEANFDCACGYDRDAAPYPERIEECALELCIDIAVRLMESDTARRLIEIWRRDAQSLGISEYTRLRYWYRDLDLQEEEAEALLRIREFCLASGTEWEICSACQNYVRGLIEMKCFEDALREFLRLVPHLAPARTDWWRFGLGRFVLEDCMDLALALPEHGEKLWSWAEPFLHQAGNMHGNLYKKAARAAERMGDIDFAGELNRRYEELMRF